MDDLYLSETEQRYFSDLFVCCDSENSGNVSITKAIDLFKSGNISNDVLSQITDICCHKETNENQIGNKLTRRQFYSMLKLIAAHQSNIPVDVDLLNCAIELPLPRFTWLNNTTVGDSDENHVDAQQQEILLSNTVISTTSTDSEIDIIKEDDDRQQGPGIAIIERSSLTNKDSPCASSTASDSPTPTNSIQERSWVAISGNWQGLVCEEQRQLLGTEEESSDRHSSEEDTEVADEVWTITPEQREYYANQFRSLQPDLSGLLAGPIARLFFEKSRLPVSELRKIWQLSDVSKDGALSLQEFNIAMHLVVLRRNHISLPSILPHQLMSTSLYSAPSSPPSAPAPLTAPPPPLSTKESASAKEWTKFVDSPTSSISSPGPKPVNFDFQKASVEKDPKILHPVPLRLTPEISGTGAGGIVQHQQHQQLDELDASSLQLELINTNSPKKSLEPNEIKPIQRPQPKKVGLKGAIPPPPATTADGGPLSLPAPKKEPPPPPPPRPFKSHGRSSSLDLNRLGKSCSLLGTPTPPTVPPRISPNIPSPNKKVLVNQRSEGGAIADAPLPDFNYTFADFNYFQGQQAEGSTNEKYENVCETIFPGDIFEADRKKIFAQFIKPENENVDIIPIPRKHGAFQVYRKPNSTTTNSAQSSQNKESPVPLNPPPLNEENAKWELFKKLKEQNTVLLRLCQELSQELADIREERTTLRLRLEQQQTTIV